MSAGTYRLDTIPDLASMVRTMDGQLSLQHAHNHWIVTRYSDGKDCIGLHSDKVKDWAEGSCFAVVKLGAPRPFVFTQAVGGHDVEIFHEVLEPGTAVIVGYAANQLVKHGVPAVADSAASGSIVGRCIKTALPWPTVAANIAKAKANKARVAGVKRTHATAPAAYSE